MNKPMISSMLCWAGLAVGLCMGGAAIADNSCVYANDGECDDPTVPGHMYTVCAPGTDDNDCSNPAGLIGGGGTAGGGGSGLLNPCPYTNDGDCDEPNGLNLCAPGTDVADCSDPNSYYGDGSGYAGAGSGAAVPNTPAGGSPDTYAPWTRITNDQRHYATQPGGVLGLMISNGMAFEAGDYTIFYGVTDGSGPHAPIHNIQSASVTLNSGVKYIARATSGGLEYFGPGGAALNMYRDPRPGFAMIYARNNDVMNWRAICVLPAGWPMSYCGP